MKSCYLTFVSLLKAASLCCFVLMSVLVDAAESDKAKPNIIFIMADDLGISDLGSYGRNDIDTPNIDRLAAQGMRFTDSYANASVCSPTRVALMTGRYQQRQRVGLDEPLAGDRSIGLKTGQDTLPNQLKEQGYNTALVGKWHLGLDAKFSPLKHGYDEFWGLKGGGVDYYEHKIVFGKIEFHDLWHNDEEVYADGYLTDILADKSVETIKRLGAEQAPFLLSLHFTAPHWPWESPDSPESAENVHQSYHMDGGTMAIYRSMVKSLDDNVGKVLAALEETGEAENTIVVFTSDNGGERFSKVWPYNGMKAELLEGGIRAPLIVRWPNQVEAGAETDQMAITMDWFPTFVNIAGGVATESDGMDLAPVLKGATSHDRTLFWRHKAHQQAAIRKGDYKYLSIGGNEYLFNVLEDPQERANLKGHLPEMFEALKTTWLKWNDSMLPYPENSMSADHKYFKNIPERY